METFLQIIQADKPVLVDFHATWCGPCKAMEPLIKEIGNELTGKARVLKIDIDKNEVAANHYQVKAVPTFIIFKSGQAVWRHSGMIGKKDLVAQLLAFT